MAINHPTWVAGTAAQRLISVTKLNQLSADGINSVDDIHKQYCPGYYSYLDHYLDIDTGVSYITSDTTGTILVEERYNAGVTYVPIGTIAFKLLPSVSFTNLNIKFKGQVSGAALVVRDIGYYVSKNGARLVSSSKVPTATSPSWDSYSETIALSGVAGDIIDAGVFLRCLLTGDASTLHCKDIEIYFS